MFIVKSQRLVMDSDISHLWQTSLQISQISTSIDAKTIPIQTNLTSILIHANPNSGQYNFNIEYKKNHSANESKTNQ